MAVEENLAFAGYEVVVTGDGKEGFRLAREGKPDMILLDIMLPGMSGYDICRRLRDSGMDMPIVMLTARGEEFDKLHGFEMGADDYVTKPFSLNELLARIKAILARGKNRHAGIKEYKFGDCVLDMDARILKKGGKEVVLTKTEFDLLSYFCTNEGKALSREQVMNDVWGMEYFGTQRSLDSFVAALRSKIEKKPKNPQYIQTVHGVGYKFVK